MRRQARRLLAVAARDPQAQRERDQLIKRLNRLGVLDEEATLDDVLALDLDAFLRRRLQTQAYMKGLARTPKQARQLIVHGHVNVGGRRVTVPSYLVDRTEEPTLRYDPSSPLTDQMHPARPDAEEPAKSDPAEAEEEPEAEEPAEPEEEAKEEPETEEEAEGEADADEAEEAEPDEADEGETETAEEAAEGDDEPEAEAEAEPATKEEE